MSLRPDGVAELGPPSCRHSSVIRHSPACAEVAYAAVAGAKAGLRKAAEIRLPRRWSPRRPKTGVQNFQKNVDAFCALLLKTAAPP